MKNIFASFVAPDNQADLFQWKINLYNAAKKEPPGISILENICYGFSISSWCEILWFIFMQLPIVLHCKPIHLSFPYFNTAHLQKEQELSHSLQCV